MKTQKTYGKTGESELVFFEYDDQKNPIKRMSGDNVTYEYEYDKNRNWISKILYFNGFPTQIYERTIEYYE